MTVFLRELHEPAPGLAMEISSRHTACNPERRGKPRYLAKVVDAWLVWQCATSRKAVATRLLILDFSESGALVTVDEAPPVSATAWLGLDRPMCPLGVEVRLVGVTTTKRGPHMLRLAFTTPCPYALFKAVVLGERENGLGLIPSHGRIKPLREEAF